VRLARRLSIQRVCAVALVAVALVAAGCGSKHSKGSSAAPATGTTPDEQAANGPLVGDPTLIASEQSCERNQPNLPWFPTIAAFEVYDSARTHLYGCAHFLGSMASANRDLAYQSTDISETPYHIVTEGPKRLFI